MPFIKICFVVICLFACNDPVSATVSPAWTGTASSSTALADFHSLTVKFALSGHRVDLSQLSIWYSVIVYVL